MNNESPLDAFVKFLETFINWMASDPWRFSIIAGIFLVLLVIFIYRQGVEKGKKSSKKEIKIPLDSDYEIGKIDIKEKE